MKITTLLLLFAVFTAGCDDGVLEPIGDAIANDTSAITVPSCDELATCGVEVQCTIPGQECAYLEACPGDAVCVNPIHACMMECNTTECALMESYPLQIGCF